MTLPPSILILGEKYIIKRCKGLIQKEGIEGYVLAHDFIIGIDSSLKGRVLKRVFYHEVAHAYAFESGLHELLSSQAIEQFCQTMSALLSQVS